MSTAGIAPSRRRPNAWSKKPRAGRSTAIPGRNLGQPPAAPGSVDGEPLRECAGLGDPTAEPFEVAEREGIAGNQGTDRVVRRIARSVCAYRQVGKAKMGETADTATPEPLTDRRNQKSFDRAPVELGKKDDSAPGLDLEGLRSCGQRRRLRADRPNENFGVFRAAGWQRPEGRISTGRTTARAWRRALKTGPKRVPSRRAGFPSPRLARA